MIKCLECEKEFSDDLVREIRTTKEIENGVANLFCNSTPIKELGLFEDE